MKVPSTRANPSRAVQSALDRLAAQHGVSAAEIERFCHGTTVATNAVIERKGVIATEGFRDILEIGRQDSPADVRSAARARRRAGWRWSATRGGDRADLANGAVILPLDEVSMRAAVDALLGEGVEAIAVCLLFAFLNPIHERRIREHIAAVAPKVACRCRARSIRHSGNTSARS